MCVCVHVCGSGHALIQCDVTKLIPFKVTDCADEHSPAASSIELRIPGFLDLGISEFLIVLKF